MVGLTEWDLSIGPLAGCHARKSAFAFETFHMRKERGNVRFPFFSFPEIIVTGETFDPHPTEPRK